jgi:hypothetical protein
MSPTWMISENRAGTRNQGIYYSFFLETFKWNTETLVVPLPMKRNFGYRIDPRMKHYLVRLPFHQEESTSSVFAH